MVNEEKNQREKDAFEVKVDLATMLKGGVIMEVTTPEQAKIAEEAGAIAVVALDKSPEELRHLGNIARMPHPEVIQKIQEAVFIPVMAKCRVGHFVEAQILEALFVDFIDESEALTVADEENYIDKHHFKIPFVCDFQNLGDALRRIGEGAAMLRSKGSMDEGNIVNTVKQIRSIIRDIRILTVLDPSEWMNKATEMRAPFHLVKLVAETGKLPVPLFAGGDIITAADAALMMQLGVDSIFVGLEIFNSVDSFQNAKAIVSAVNYYQDPEVLAKISQGLLDEMNGRDKDDILSHKSWQ